MASVRDPPTLREERKVVTALFADLVGSTAVGARFDPEDAREIVSGGVAPMIEAIERYGGTIKDLAGDGVLALFGAPVSHEDDVERAVLAGLAISSALSEYGDDVARRWGHEGLDVRVGIETGLAVLGPLGAGGRVEYGAVGDVLNTAARLQSAARPGAVLVGESARREVAGLFEWEPPSALALKGKDEPVVASVALRPSDPRSRAAATRRPDPMFVGRAAELEAVDEALSALAGGTGSAIFVIGEPGIGKSRLVAEARRRALSGRYGSPVRWLEARCLSYAESVPYGLFRDLFAGSLDLPRDAGADQGPLAVGADPALAIDPADTPYLEHVLDGRGDTPGGDNAEALRDRVFAAVESTFLAIASSGPVVISLEDLHWSDPTSLALTERLLRSVTRAPLVVFATLRPEPGHPSTAMIRATADHLGSRGRTIALDSLSLEECQALLASLPGVNAVPAMIRRAILETTDGNPFFLEEQVTSLANTGRLILDPDRGWRFEGDATLDIPRSVERLLLAQIDRLAADAKDVLVAASVLGREFARDVLTRVLGEDADVGPTLVELERVDLLRREDRDSEVAYRFRHALIQEAAYRSLLKRARRDLHGRAAAAIEASHEGRSETVPGALGHHLLQAGEMARAVPHLMTAGDRAREVFANEEAFTWYERALEAIDAMTRAEREGLNALEADLHARRGEVLGLAGRFQAAREAYRRSIELAASGDPLRLAQIRTDAALIEISDHRYDEGLAELDRAERDLGRVADVDPPDSERMSVWFEIQDSRMAAFYWLDDLSAYAELIERVRPFVEAHGTPRQRARFFETLLTFALRRSRYVVDEEMLGYAHANLAASDEAGVASGAAWARFNLGFTLLWAGRFDEARALLTESLHEGDRMGDRTLVSRARTYLMVVGRRRGDERVVERSIDQVIASAREVSLLEYEAMALANRSWVYARAGRTTEAEADAGAALELWRSLPVRYPFDWMALWPLIGIELERGRVPQAIVLARDMFAQHQQPLPAELRSQLELGIEAWDADDPDRAERELRVALPLATRLAYA